MVSYSFSSYVQQLFNNTFWEKLSIIMETDKQQRVYKLVLTGGKQLACTSHFMLIFSFIRLFGLVNHPHVKHAVISRKPVLCRDHVFSLLFFLFFFFHNNNANETCIQVKRASKRIALLRLRLTYFVYFFTLAYHKGIPGCIHLVFVIYAIDINSLPLRLTLNHSVDSFLWLCQFFFITGILKCFCSNADVNCTVMDSDVPM